MGQEEYRNCMSKNMGGGRLKGLSKEERRIEFCTIAKFCSKGMPHEEAKKVCSLPKVPKPPKSSKRKGGGTDEKRLLELGHCMAENIDMDQASNINSIETAIVNALMACGLKND